MSQIYVNNFKTTLAANIGSTDLTIPVVDASMLPSTTISPTNYFMVTLEYNGVIEIVQIIGVSYNNLIVNPTTTIGRGAEGTAAAIFPIGTRVEGRITAGTLTNIIYLANTANTATNNSLAAVSSSLSSSISSETSRATTAEGGLSALVATDISTLSASTSASFSTTNGNVSAEVTRAMTAEASEAGARAAADSNLTILINEGKVQPGTVVSYLGYGTPSGGYLQLLASPQNGLSIYGTYAALFAVIGNAYGGIGGVFSIPGILPGYGLVAGTPGSSTVGSVISHNHPATTNAYTSAGYNGYGIYYLQSQIIPATVTVGYSGGAANLAAGLNATFWIKY